MAVPPAGKVVTLLMLLKLLYITAVRIFWTQKMRCMQTLLHYKFKIHTLNTSSLQHWTILYSLRQLAFLFVYQWTWLNLCLPYLLKNMAMLLHFALMKKMFWFSQLACHKDGCNHEQFLKNSAEVLVCLWLEETSFLFINFFCQQIFQTEFSTIWMKYLRNQIKPYEWNIWEIIFFQGNFNVNNII